MKVLPQLDPLRNRVEKQVSPDRLLVHSYRVHFGGAMQSATDKIQVFTPEVIARKIGGDTSDVMRVLNVCFLKGADAAVQWMVQGDYSKPWVFSDSDKRGDALLDMRTTKLCADLHEVTVRPADHGPVSKADELKIIKTVLMDNFPFSGRQFHRGEIARWLVTFGLQSEYEFSQEAAPVVAAGASDNVQSASDGPAKTATVERGWIMKKAALIKRYTNQWPTINRDFQDASQNGLSKAAKAPRHGEWFEADALNWARQRGKLTEETAQTTGSHATPFTGLTHIIKA